MTVRTIGPATLYLGDCLEVLRAMPDNSVDAIVTDPPYGISFMARKWDYDVPSVEIWAECLRVAKPGAHLLSFAGTRTQHRMACRIEDAGWEIRDMIAWMYGSGFPKSLDVSKQIDKSDAGEAQHVRRLAFTAWVMSTGVTSASIDEATGTNMGGHYTTQASQPAIMTREHLEACRHLFQEIPQWVECECDIRSVESQNFAMRNILRYEEMMDTTKAIPGFSGKHHSIGYDGTKRLVPITEPLTPAAAQWSGWGTAIKPAMEPITMARKPLSGTVAANVLEYSTSALNIGGCRIGESDRWPANVIHDGSEEVIDLFGDPARFFYCAKASAADRDHGLESYERTEAAERVNRKEGSAGMESPRAGAGRTAAGGNHHPTVKPTDLMRYLCRLVTPPGGVVLDPFMGSGSTGKAAKLEGFQFIGIDREAEYLEIASRRIEAAHAQGDLFTGQPAPEQPSLPMGDVA